MSISDTLLPRSLHQVLLSKEGCIYSLCVRILVWVESWLQNKINHNYDAHTAQVMVWASMPMKNCWLALYFRGKKGNLERRGQHLNSKNTDNLCMLYSSQTPLSILEIFEELYFPSQIFPPEKKAHCTRLPFKGAMTKLVWNCQITASSVYRHTCKINPPEEAVEVTEHYFFPIYNCLSF